jgi:6-bladed beta-propeller protein
MGLALGRRPLLVILLAAVTGSVSCGDEMPEGRRVVASMWDTTFVIGSTNVDDTVLIDPSRLALWDDQIAVLESQVQRVRVFDRSGKQLWLFGSQGQGPGEIGSAEEIFVSQEGHLRIWDGRNRKLLEVDHEGDLVGEQYFRDLWGLSTHPTPYGDRLIWTQLAEDRPAFITTVDGLEVVDSVSVPWPVPEDSKYRVSLMGFKAGSEDAWVVGLWIGPLFAVGSREGVGFYPFVQDFHFAYAPSRAVQSDQLADSAYFGTVDVGIVEDEVFFLSGGRPKRRSHPEEPTRFIDVYGLDGEYQRSYELPFHSWAMATDDQGTFYVLTNVDGVYPHLFGLRPKID